MLEQYFSSEQIDLIRDGVRKYIRLIGFIGSPNLLELKWLADEWDLHSALETLSRAVKASHTMVGKRKYQGVDYDIAREVKKDMQTYLMSGRTEPETALLKKINQPMYYLVISPVLDLFALPFDHQTAIDIVDDVVAEVQRMIWSQEDYGDYDDALVARMQVQKLIRETEEKRLAEINATKRKRKHKRNPIIELFAELVEEEEPELEIDLMYS